MEDVNKQLLKDAVPFWNDMMAHPNRDEFWKKRAILPHLKNVAPAVMVVTGWYDAEDLYGSFKTYQSIETQNPKVNNVLVVGPWHHGGWASADGDKLGPANFGSKTAAFYRAEIELPFFEKYLKDEKHPPPAEATVFETGSNAWRTFDDWPPQERRAETALSCAKTACSMRARRRPRKRPSTSTSAIRPSRCRSPRRSRRRWRSNT